MLEAVNGTFDSLTASNMKASTDPRKTSQGLLLLWSYHSFQGALKATRALHQSSDPEYVYCILADLSAESIKEIPSQALTFAQLLGPNARRWKVLQIHSDPPAGRGLLRTW